MSSGEESDACDASTRERAEEIAAAFFDPDPPLAASDEAVFSWGPRDGGWTRVERTEAWIHFFAAFSSFAAPYAFADIDRGLSVMRAPGGILDELITDSRILWSGPQPLEPGFVPERIHELVSAMARLYSPYLLSVRYDAELSFHMWWHSLADPLARIGDRVVPGDPPRTVADVHLATLEEILAIDDMHSQYCALHGLGHLEHPDRPAIVSAFIDQLRESGEIENWGLWWLEQCRDGTVL